MPDRTKIYIAADGVRDREAVKLLLEWNALPDWGFDFFFAHDWIDDHDTAAPCAVKATLQAELDASRAFLLLSDGLDSLYGSCRSCSNYGGWSHCARGGKTDERGYLRFACDKALEAGIPVFRFSDNDYVNQSASRATLHLPLQADVVKQALRR